MITIADVIIIAIITIAIITIAIITITIITIAIRTIVIIAISPGLNANTYAHNQWEAGSRFRWKI
jgi:hypothetical protein